jgi:hypothetical protein
MSIRIQDIFGLDDELRDDSSSHTLQRFIESYLYYFGPLWPLLAKQNFDCDSLHPVLYLTLTSIGAMYSGPRHSHYGTMMHEHIRKTLLAIAFELEDVDDGSLWLGQARLLTQVAALYFGQKRAFSYAQHLGGILVAQARRMNIFSAQTHQNSCLEEEAGGASTIPAEERLSKWLHLEARKRLAFGILRAESYTSVLLNTRPLVSSEEINLELPCAEDIWGGNFATASRYLEAVRQDRNLGRMRFSDMVRIVMDREEIIPTLEPLGYELLLFGLQHSVWRFCHDPGVFQRLTGSNYMTTRPEYLGISQKLRGQRSYSSHSTINLSATALRRDMLESGKSPDHLAGPHRAMDDLRLDCDRIFLALQKWKQSFEVGRTSLQLREARTSLLSSLLLYHTSYLRLQAPIENLHLISYQLASKRSTPEKVVNDVYQWSQSLSSRAAVQHACSIWTLINQESQRPENSRAQFNFLAFAGLHHAAVVLWAYASTHHKTSTTDESMFFITDANSDAGGGIRICKEESERLLNHFPRLYKSISPARWSSFATAAINLLQAQFPLAL